MPLIHLIRHGRPAVTRVLLGSSDVPLASEDFGPLGLPVDAVYCSPLIRASRTAQLLFPDLPLRVLPGLAERDLGEWERKTWAEVEQGWPALSAEASANWFATLPPGGEQWDEFADRVEAAWGDVEKTGNVAIVAHIGVNAVLCHLATGSPLVSFEQDYLEVVSFAISD